MSHPSISRHPVIFLFIYFLHFWLKKMWEGPKNWLAVPRWSGQKQQKKRTEPESFANLEEEQAISELSGCSRQCIPSAVEDPRFNRRTPWATMYSKVPIYSGRKISSSILLEKDVTKSTISITSFPCFSLIIALVSIRVTTQVQSHLRSLKNTNARRAHPLAQYPGESESTSLSSISRKQKGGGSQLPLTIVVGGTV